MILHPHSARRVPLDDDDQAPPIARLFSRFPRLYGLHVNKEEKDQIIENITPSATQEALLQVMIDISCIYWL